MDEECSLSNMSSTFRIGMRLSVWAATELSMQNMAEARTGICPPGGWEGRKSIPPAKLQYEMQYK